MIIYIHGFGSSGGGTKAVETTAFFKNDTVLAPTLPIEPVAAIDFLSSEIEKSREKVFLIGSSLGGFYSIILSAKYDISAALINPAVNVFGGLRGYIGKQTRDNGEEFEWREYHVIQLEEMYKKYFAQLNGRNIMLLLAKDDELLPFNKTLSLIKNPAKTIILDECTHRFLKYNEVLPEIKSFFENCP